MSDAPSSDPQGAIGFDFVDRRVVAAVERVAATDPNPGDPFRGLYISDETALRLTQGDSSSSADERLRTAARALGLDLLDTAVLGVCASPRRRSAPDRRSGASRSSDVMTSADVTPSPSSRWPTSRGLGSLRVTSSCRYAYNRP